MPRKTTPAGKTSSTRPPIKVNTPAFGDPKPTPDPTTFVVNHPSDTPYYDARAIQWINANAKPSSSLFAVRFAAAPSCPYHVTEPCAVRRLP